MLCLLFGSSSYTGVISTVENNDPAAQQICNIFSSKETTCRVGKNLFATTSPYRYVILLQFSLSLKDVVADFCYNIFYWNTTNVNTCERSSIKISKQFYLLPAHQYILIGVAILFFMLVTFQFRPCVHFAEPLKLNWVWL